MVLQFYSIVSLLPDRKVLFMISKEKTNGNYFKIFLLTIGHLLNDIHGNFLPTFLPTIIGKLGLSLTQAGVLTSLPGLIHVFLQPMLGYLSDRQSRPYMIIFGPMLTALGASMLPLSPTYAVSFLVVGLWGIGSALFHPQGLGSVGYLTSPGHISFNISLFQVGGAFGITLSSLYAVSLVKTVGLGYMPVVCMIPVTILALLYYFYIPDIHGGTDKRKPDTTGFFKTALGVFKKIWPVWTVAFSRDLTTQAIRFLIPVLISSQGGGLGRIGTTLFILNLSRSVLTMIVARISDSIGKRPTLLITLGISPLLLLSSVLVEGTLSMVLLAAGFALLGCSLPITAATAQELAPESRSMASSLIMGLSFGISGMMMTPVGALADITSIKTTMLCVIFIPYISVIILLTRWREIPSPSEQDQE